MAEFVGTTASIVGITTAALQSVQFLVTTIHNVKDAPTTVKNINVDLRAVELVLQELKDVPQDGSSQIIRGNLVQFAIENCDSACKAFQSQVDYWMKYSKEDKLFWISRWKVGLFGQERIRTFQGQLNNCKSTLMVALSAATLLATTSQTDLVKEQRDTILEAYEVDWKQDLLQAQKETAEIERNLQLVTVRKSTSTDQDSEITHQELIQALKQQQASNFHFREMCEEALSTTVYERTRQKIKGVKATNDSSALAGFINTSRDDIKMDQDISDVTADNWSFAAAGVIKNMDFKDMHRRQPGHSKDG
ncbi:hypothetical protein PG996_005260 [Apiospora saccharicola]|uniref:Azaphilone pigments biosynthesis cluster protein L N-terminal domain-containing protein n=1 Tax=Apiospora saccharicola TaxID=335842 RepID=A0ABR1VL06_9PEZI